MLRFNDYRNRKFKENDEVRNMIPDVFLSTDPKLYSVLGSLTVFMSLHAPNILQIRFHPEENGCRE